MEVGDFGAEIARMVANEKTVVVGEIRIRQRADHVVVEVSDHLVAREATARDHPKTHPRLSQRAQHGGSTDAE